MMDAEALDKHLRETPWFIERHRARMNPGDFSYSDTETAFAGFGPKLPFNDSAMEMADHEALLVGSLARHCMNMGSLTPIPLTGFWWSRGRCMGMKQNGLNNVYATCRHMRHRIGDILNTEGVEEWWPLMENMRSLSLRVFPQEADDEWLNMDEAQDFTGRDSRTINMWVSDGIIQSIGDGEGMLVSKTELRLKMALIYANSLRSLHAARLKRGMA